MTEDETITARTLIREARELADLLNVPAEQVSDVRDKLLRVECRARAHGRPAIVSAAYRARKKLKENR